MLVFFYILSYHLSMIIEGTLEEIVYRNEENGYTVGILDFKGTMVTVVGKLITANEGENLSLEGEFVKNKKYGYQFAFSSYQTILPKSLAGIERYLSSGLIKGVGPVTAKNIVSQFKEDTFSIIEMAPYRLAEIKGISKEKALEIGNKFSALKNIQNTVMFLQGYNITTNMALKIFEVYGDKTMEIVKNNPYKLVEDIDGIGFLSADKIAKNLGIENNSEFRIRAGIVHTINTSTEKNGNTYLPKKLLLSQASEVLDLDHDENLSLFETALECLVNDKTCIILWQDGVEIVMLTKYYRYENGIAQKIALLNGAIIKTKLNVEREIDFFEKRNNLSFHEEQRKAIENSINSGVSVITGGPGTGKTTIVKCIIEILKQNGMQVMLLAPTGRASKRLSDATGEEAKTIHRALEVNPLNNGGSRFVHNENCPLKTNAVIIDEVSMVDVMLMFSLLKALPRDCKLILVGDKDQLPSVGAGNVLGDILESKLIQTTMLTKIFRQADNSLIISNAHLINQGVMPVIDNCSNDFFFEEKFELSDIKNSVIELITKRLPKFTSLNSNQIQVLAPMKAGVCGIDNLNKSLQEIINPPHINKQELSIGLNIFRVGDKVMQTTNNYNLVWKRMNGFIEEEGEGVFNGDIGFIEMIDYQTGETVVVFEDGRRCIYPRTDLGDLSLAYAITIHKSQGSEFDVVVIPVISGASIILTRNLIYTAVTRAKKMVVLVGEKKNLKRMVANAYTVKRFTLLKDLIIKSVEKISSLFD